MRAARRARQSKVSLASTSATLRKSSPITSSCTPEVFLSRSKTSRPRRPRLRRSGSSASAIPCNSASTKRGSSSVPDKKFASATSATRPSIIAEVSMTLTSAASAAAGDKR